MKVAPFFDEYLRKIEDRSPFLLRWTGYKFLDLRHQVHYSLRFFRSEGVNGFHKDQEGILKFVGTTINAVNNESCFYKSIIVFTTIY